MKTNSQDKDRIYGNININYKNQWQLSAVRSGRDFIEIYELRKEL
jgi:hypothetical protein